MHSESPPNANLFDALWAPSLIRYDTQLTNTATLLTCLRAVLHDHDPPPKSFSMQAPIEPAETSHRDPWLTPLTAIRAMLRDHIASSKRDSLQALISATETLHDDTRSRLDFVTKKAESICHDEVLRPNRILQPSVARRKVEEELRSLDAAMVELHVQADELVKMKRDFMGEVVDTFDCAIWDAAEDRLEEEGPTEVHIVPVQLLWREQSAQHLSVRATGMQSERREHKDTQRESAPTISTKSKWRERDDSHKQAAPTAREALLWRRRKQATPTETSMSRAENIRSGLLS